MKTRCSRSLAIAAVIMVAAVGSTACNDQLRAARDSLVPHLEGNGLRYAIANGGMTLTVRDSMLDAHVDPRRVGGLPAAQAVLKQGKSSVIERAAGMHLTPMSRARSAAAARALNPQPLPPGKTKAKPAVIPRGAVVQPKDANGHR